MYTLDLQAVLFHDCFLPYIHQGTGPGLIDNVCTKMFPTFTCTT